MSYNNTIKAIIIGNGISGLVIANCFIKAGIDFIILEKEEEKKEYHGSDFFLHPNGIRLLDQLGIWEDIKHLGAYTKYIDYLNGENKKWTTLDWSEIEERYGYPVFSIIRQKLLIKLWEKIDEDKILLGKKLNDVEIKKDNVKVFCDDGSFYEGDFLIGADGARSKTRDYIYKLSNLKKKELDNKFEAIFGVSKISKNADKEKLKTRMQWHIQKNLSYFLHIQPNDDVTWFLGFKNDDNNNVELNKYKKEDIEDMKRKYSDLPTTHGCNFGEVLNNSKIAVKVNLEECLFEKWYYDRIVLIGDAAHKLLPFSGQGANQAIEDCAVLTNILYEYLIKNNNKNYNEMFEKYENIRKPRIQEIMDESHFTSDLINIPDYISKTKSWLFFKLAPNILYKKVMDKRYRIRPILKFIKFDKINNSTNFIEPEENSYY